MLEFHYLYNTPVSYTHLLERTRGQLFQLDSAERRFEMLADIGFIALIGRLLERVLHISRQPVFTEQYDRRRMAG